MTDFSARPVVVVGTDGSATATEGVRRAADIVRNSGGQLHIVTAAEALPRSPVNGTISREFRTIGKSPGLQADHILRRVAEGPAKGLDVTFHIEGGDVVDALTRVADAVAAGVIVVGNQRPAMMPKFIAGSISDRLAHQARCDVLVVNTDNAAA